MKGDVTKNGIAKLVQSFFCERLLAQQNASPQTVSSYRDTVRLLLKFVSARLNRQPTDIAIGDLDAPMILSFLDDLENKRGNSERTRNTRLAAIRALVKHIALHEPTFLPHAGRLLAIPMKRWDRPALVFLSAQEVEAITATPDASTWSGQRDQMLFVMLYNTGARVSELLGVQLGDVPGGGVVRLHGKGRKERIVPLWKTTVAQLRAWCRRIDTNATSPLFPNRMGQPMTRSGVEYRLRVAVQKAAVHCPSLKHKAVSPHTFRHTTAMHLLQANVDITTIALWLGHESPATTHTYIEADLAMKEAAISKLKGPRSRTVRYRASDAVLAFLEGL